jgi:hypothetical protein
MRRRGDTGRCPACGWGLDAEAYRCPKCRIYFCYKCRARVGRGEIQFQCADQSCPYYGKLLCAGCTVMEQEPDTTLLYTVPAFKVETAPAFFAGVLLGGVVGVCAGSGWIGLVVAVATWVVAALLAAQRKTQYRTVFGASHRCCIECRRPVKQL